MPKINRAKFKDRKYICSSGGVVGPNAICGKVSVYHDEKGHRCMAHGLVKCSFKRTLKDE